jgi:hypothetical protein
MAAGRLNILKFLNAKPAIWADHFRGALKAYFGISRQNLHCWERHLGEQIYLS